MDWKAFYERQRLKLIARRDEEARRVAERGEGAFPYARRDRARIAFALRRMEEEQYGLCTNCGVPIDVALLEAIPETPFCARCVVKCEGQ